jgi:hypothetical protein
MQADPLLHEALADQSRIARFDSDSGSSADAIEEPVAIEHRLHAEFGEQFAIDPLSILMRRRSRRKPAVGVPNAVGASAVQDGLARPSQIRWSKFWSGLPSRRLGRPSRTHWASCRKLYQLAEFPRG